MMRCKNCGATGTLAEIRAEQPQAISCCPERDAKDDLEERVQRLEKIVARLCPDKSDDI